jgi:hypothetical protein
VEGLESAMLSTRLAVVMVAKASGYKFLFSIIVVNTAITGAVGLAEEMDIPPVDLQLGFHKQDKS